MLTYIELIYDAIGYMRTLIEMRVSTAAARQGGVYCSASAADIRRYIIYVTINVTIDLSICMIIHLPSHQSQ